MSFFNTIRKVIPVRVSSFPLFSHRPLVQQLLPADQQWIAPPTEDLEVRVSAWQTSTADFCQRQGDALSRSLGKIYVQVRDPTAGRRIRRAQVWLRPAAPPRISSRGQTEEEVDRSLWLSGTIFGLDLLSATFFPAIRVIIAPMVLIAIYPLARFSLQQMQRYRRPNAALLVCLTALFCVGTGNYGLGVITMLVNHFALKLQFRIQDDSQHRLVDVFKQQPNFVYTLVKGVEVRIPFAQIRSGDIIVVHAGEAIPVDGTVSAGAASVDQHLLTGESQPIEKGVGEEVFAATMVLTGSLQIRADKAGSETMVAQIGQILRKTVSDKTDMQMRADALADRTVTPTLLLSLATLPFLGPLAAAAIITCHFGMRMALVGPLAVLNYFRLLSYQHILIKDGRTFDHLRDVDTVVFDKTGTLTIHQPHVRQIYAWDNIAEHDVLAWAAAAEYKQTHPIARAIIEVAERRGIAIPDLSSAAYAVGFGLTVSLGDNEIRVGSHRFMQQSGIALAPRVLAAEEAAHAQGHSLVLVACDNQIVGALELVPTLRPEAHQVIADLRQRGIKHIVIISGDREAPTRKLAHDLGIDQYFAETLPQDKASIIDQLQQAGQSICYVGDGINDAIALKKAHVSVSMRGASTVATDTAQIVLLAEGLANLGQLFDCAADFDRTMKISFILMLTPSLLAMGGVLFLGHSLVQAVWLKQLGLVLSAGAAMEPLVRLAQQQQRIKARKMALPVSSEDLIRER